MRALRPKVISKKPPASAKFFQKSQKRPRALPSGFGPEVALSPERLPKQRSDDAVAGENKGRGAVGDTGNHGGRHAHLDTQAGDDQADPPPA